ncbi:glycosyltransferase [Chloroflexi bacterium TSY]|nr:glycosyltransferase [Chloroflexi bacterium TSY]
MSLHISVVATVLNEGSHLRRLVDSLLSQTRPPDEIVICDGGSQDDTIEILSHYQRQKGPPIKVIVEPGANISRGRNRAIAAAAGQIIATTDAGVELNPTWLEQLVDPWLKGENSTPEADLLAVAGFFFPDVSGPFQTAMGATVLPLVDDIDPNKFLPSSRSVAFTKSAWEKAGGYPEWLDYCEDLLFDFALNAQRPSEPTAFTWAPNAIVYYRPRENLPDFWKQYYRYARGDGKADLWRKRHAVRYATYFILFPVLLSHALWGFFASWLGWLGLVIGVIAYCRRPWQRLKKLGHRLNRLEMLYAVLLVPIIRVVGDVAKMTGYPVGLWWRWQNRKRQEIYWRTRHALTTCIKMRILTP